MSETTKLEPNENHYRLAFIKEVAKYFMDFLETDFHRQGNPRRTVRFRNNDNLKIGLNLNKYQSFVPLVWKAIQEGFKNDLKTITKGVHETKIPQNLLGLIQLQLKKITQQQVHAILTDAGDAIQKSSLAYHDDYEAALTTALENISQIIKNGLVVPLIGNLEKPLEYLDLGDENSIYLMEEELTTVLTTSLESKTSEVVKRLLAKEDLEVAGELEQVFELEETKNSIYVFFEGFGVADLFAELLEMDRNRSILDKQEFYLYFCDITFNKAKYPIFYIPFSIVKQCDTLVFECDAQVYINKKALDYIAQEYNTERGTKGSLRDVSDRIIYLADYQENFNTLIGNILNEISNFFELDTTIDVFKPVPQLAKSLWTRISNSCYIALFDKSDEAIVNDYEDILQQLNDEDSEIAKAFNVLIEDFIHKNPQVYNLEIDEKWDNTETSDRLTFRSPIPLNSEQLQILSAIKKDGCKYITVEGPPGTGKSHTITAVLFNAILKNQSVLVLSDKKEALDVVEEKITETMNKVRVDENFQNPILRLGKTGSTYSKILAASSINSITTYHRATKNNYENLEANITKIERSLKEEIEATVLSYEDISLREIQELHILENRIKNLPEIAELAEVTEQADGATDLEEIRKVFWTVKESLFDPNSSLIKFFTSLGLHQKDYDNYDAFSNLIGVFQSVQNITQQIKGVYGEKIANLSLFSSFSKQEMNVLNDFISQYALLKKPIIGYLFNKKNIASLDLEFKKQFPYTKCEHAHSYLRRFKDVVDIYQYALVTCGEQHIPCQIDCIRLIHELFQADRAQQSIEHCITLKSDIDYVFQCHDRYPKTFAKLGINDLNSLADNPIIQADSKEFDCLIRYVTLRQKLQNSFRSIPELKYEQLMKYLEDLITTQMTYVMDGRLVEFYLNNKSTAKTIRDIIRKKQRFPKDEFAKLKEAFPCIPAGIRDYSEYIPLEPGLFDLVIIDEASQVSIAQAFPALLRAKKVLILGDRKQFSNVKSAQARTDINREYLNNLETVFRKEVSGDTAKLNRLAKFNIKTSILEFFAFISNYDAQLLKHFRGYKETISYSNRFFYQDHLQVMKIRGKPVNDVIKFSFVQQDGKTELYPNTNIPEVKCIIKELEQLEKAGDHSSVCIITPHTNQQKLLMEMISKHPDKDYFFDTLQLKIFTFDTCQGEERDIVFYSMVANVDSDRLWGVFIKDLNQVDIEEEGHIKAQRLNVGFSRAKECMHFVLSKPLEQYNGSIGEALRHYHNTLEKAGKEPLPNEVDAKSPMETKVLHWLTQTNFWKQHFPDNIFLKPQFELGKYLKQLDISYSHPIYQVDFLLVYKDACQKEHKIIIEYDGFEEHFTRTGQVNEFNYNEYYSDNDVYRQTVLESYGYKFLRINRFNTGKDPIATLDARIAKLVRDNTSLPDVIENIHDTVQGLQNGHMKECPKCHEVRTQDDFKDSSLITGYGRFCKFCKGLGTKKITASTAFKDTDIKGEHCPKCGSRMVFRTGRYGPFYGCSKFPYCKGTRPY
jgi:superfamily I DNA and/or RNA helicase/very-short-patch-repair endonuclease